MNTVGKVNKFLPHMSQGAGSQGGSLELASVVGAQFLATPHTDPGYPHGISGTGGI